MAFSDKIPKTILMTIIFIVFLDVLGMTIIIPILAPIFLDSTTTILSSNVPYATRTMLLGFLMAAYPFAQFFGSPILGSLSDRHGRKKVLFISMAGSLVGYVIFAYGIFLGNLWLLFISRLLDGFTGGNISVALSSIADISTRKSKTRNFGLVGAAYGAGLIVGPFFGGILSDNTLVFWFSHATPFLFAALLTFINMVLMLVYLPETLKVRINRPLSLFSGFHNVIKAFRMTNLRTMFSVVFLIMLGFTFFTHFLPVFLIEKFHYDETLSGYLFAYLGLWIVLTQALIVKFLSRAFSPKAILSFSILIFGLSYFAVILASSSLMLYILGPLVAIFCGITLPSYNALISNIGSSKSQGEILGINQSMQSLAQCIPPIIAGFIIAIHPSWPTIIGGVITLLAWLIFILFYRDSRIKYVED
jgi:MFS transporter, DHA1 family, tetracycline resistance protein